MPNNSSRNQRNNPYMVETYAVKFHHSMAGLLWRWRTELTLTIDHRLGLLAARRPDHPHLGADRPRRHPRCRPGGSRGHAATCSGTRGA